eukprot:SAG31_NODE_33070_length_348_cov_0.819277_1_plen_115_part_11
MRESGSQVVQSIDLLGKDLNVMNNVPETSSAAANLDESELDKANASQLLAPTNAPTAADPKSYENESTGAPPAPTADPKSDENESTGAPPAPVSPPESSPRTEVAIEHVTEDVEK